MHPIIIYYHDPDTDQIMRESHVFISDDISHDHHMVNHFRNLSLETLQGISEISKVIVFSDGCSSQYKSRGPLADLSLQKLPSAHNFFGSEHGKSECDGETGVVSHAVHRAVVGRQVIINDAKEYVEWCKANLSHGSSGQRTFTRRFFLVDDVNHQRTETNVKTVAGVRKFHQVQNTDTKYKILHRDLSCYCAGCIQDGQCQNDDYVSSFSSKTIRLIIPRNQRPREGMYLAQGYMETFNMRLFLRILDF